MDDFMKMMLFSGSLKHITEKDPFSPRKSSNRSSTYPQDLDPFDDESDDDNDDWDDF